MTDTTKAEALAADSAVSRLRDALEAGPTPGPWFVPTSPLGYAVATIGKARICSDMPPGYDPSADLAYIAACDPATIRTVLDVLAAAQRERDALRELSEHLRHCRDCGETDVANCPIGQPLWDAAIPTPAATQEPTP